MVKCEILEDGEKALFYSYNGNVGLKEGPKRIWLVRSKLVRLQRFTANHNEYLRTTLKSGEIIHKLGPCNEFLNPICHSKISVENCHCLNANEAIIVYRKNDKNENHRYDRRIVSGPTVYMLQPNEWLHQFTWHGPSKTNKTSYEPGIDKFEVLNFAPNQLYYNVSDVRTADDALIRIKLMIFYELKEIETMLNATKDPIADLINCCSSDVTKFTSNKTYLSFIENCYQLNDMATYVKLVERAKYLGFEVTKVVFRGYFASPKLQLIHDKSMEMRTQLKLEHESALQENDRKYVDLKNTINRLTCEQDIELQKQINSQELDMIKNENMLILKLIEVDNSTDNLKELRIKELELMADKSVETTEITAPKMTDFMDKNEDAIMHDDSIDKGTEIENICQTETNLKPTELNKFSEVKKQLDSNTDRTPTTAKLGNTNNSNNNDNMPKILNIESVKQQPSSNSSISIVPVIRINTGPAPPKQRNVAMKNTAAGPIRQQQQKYQESHSKSLQKKQSSDSKYRLSDDDMNMFSDKDDTSFEYNSNDEFVPKNTGSDGSDVEMDAASKRKSARLSKKPKILDEYVIESSQDSTFQLQTDVNTSKEKSSDSQLRPQQTSKAPKQFARKSTASLALSHLNQNISLSNQQQHKKPQVYQKYITPSTSSNTYSQSSPLTTPILNSSSNQNSIGKQQSSELHNGSHSSSQASKITSSRNTTSIGYNSTASNHNSTATQSSNPSTAKQFKNKIVSCKPIYESKGTECVPIVKDASTQIDLDEIKLNHTVVPVPVPIHVPTPLCMYQAPMPVPILLPIPIPVPIFIPTTMKTYDRIQRRIQKLRKKLPADPYEFEILLYAEKLAREEGIPGFEDSSDGESEPECSNSKRQKTSNYEHVTAIQTSDTNGQNVNNIENNADINQIQQQQTIYNDNNSHTGNSIETNNQQVQLIQNQQLQQIQQPEQEGKFKWIYGVNLFNSWFSTRIAQLKAKAPNSDLRLPDDILKLKNDELNVLLSDFVREIRKPSGEIYAPESVYYLCLGIQHYLQEKGRVENIFLDNHLFDKFQISLNEIAMRYQIRINSEGQITSRIEEEILWESKQLGAYSPFVLLNTILYFNTKYFFLDKPESHLQLSFTNVKKHSKRNIGPNGEDYGKTVFLRYYPDFHGLEQVIYEQGENYDNPLRCPVELYNFYLSKCPESVKNRNDVFYLLPEKASLPSSPVWFSSQPIGSKMLERMINRIKMVREVNELLLAASPQSTTNTIM